MLTNGQKFANEGQRNERTHLKVVRDTSPWCAKYICEIILKSHDKLQSYGQDTNMLTNGHKSANEWPYRQTNGRTGLNFARDTSS